MHLLPQFPSGSLKIEICQCLVQSSSVSCWNQTNYLHWILVSCFWPVSWKMHINMICCSRLNIVYSPFFTCSNFFKMKMFLSTISELVLTVFYYPLLCSLWRVHMAWQSIEMGVGNGLLLRGSLHLRDINMPLWDTFLHFVVFFSAQLYDNKISNYMLS